MKHTIPTLLVFVGCHGSGKTTLGRCTARALGWRFDEEIGESLRLEALAQDPDAHAAMPQAAFDREVFRRELARDRAHAGEPRVVETWHPGNLAYALKRNPQVALESWHELRSHLQPHATRVLVQPLLISAAELKSRLREPGPEAEVFIPWLMEVGRIAGEAAQWLGLEVAPPLQTDRLTMEAAVHQVLARVQRAHQADLLTVTPGF